VRGSIKTDSFALCHRHTGDECADGAFPVGSGNVNGFESPFGIPKMCASGFDSREPELPAAYPQSIQAL
jgi:hypothetical protein